MATKKHTIRMYCLLSEEVKIKLQKNGAENTGNGWHIIEKFELISWQFLRKNGENIPGGIRIFGSMLPIKNCKFFGKLRPLIFKFIVEGFWQR